MPARPRLSMTTDYAADTGCPEPHLRAIADAGFTHVHWCHQWNTDFVYHDCEVRQIARWLKAYRLRLLDLHGSSGPEKNWTSPREYERRAGLELVKNRVQMTARLGGRVVIMHTGAEPDDPADRHDFWSQLFRSLDALEPFARSHRVRIAIENGRFYVIEKLLAKYDDDYLGLCYDSGHGNLRAGDLDAFDRLRHRLISVHLHDNDGAKDLHRLPFTGTVVWDRVACVIARSAYTGPVSLESNKKHMPPVDDALFLADAWRAAQRLTAMVELHRRTGKRQ